MRHISNPSPKGDGKGGHDALPALMKEALGKPRCLQYLVMASSSHRQTPSTFAVEAHDRFNMWKAAF